MTGFKESLLISLAGMLLMASLIACRGEPPSSSEAVETGVQVGTAQPGSTPDLQGTIDAGIRASAVAIPTAVPVPVATEALFMTALPTTVAMVIAGRTAAPTPTPVTPATPALGYARTEWRSEIYDWLVDFVARHSPREYGTGEEAAAGEFLYSLLTDMGDYKVDYQPFEFEIEYSTFTVNGEKLETSPMLGTAEGTVSGPLAYAGLGREPEIPVEGLEGAVALMKRGELRFQEKGDNAVDAGAIAAVVFNAEELLFGGATDSGLNIPMLSMSGADGERLLSEMEAGEALVADVHSGVKTLESNNIVASLKSSAETERTLILGAHYDTLPGVQGANDNASGVSVLMRLAENLKDGNLPFNLRVVLFGSGESESYGAYWYVRGMEEDEKANTMGMVNFDVVGSGLSLQLGGDPEFARVAGEIAKSMEVPFGGTEAYDDWASNHTPFEEAGIPVLLISGDNLTQILLGGEDNLQWISPRILEWAAQVGEEFVRRLAWGE